MLATWNPEVLYEFTEDAYLYADDNNQVLFDKRRLKKYLLDKKSKKFLSDLKNASPFSLKEFSHDVEKRLLLSKLHQAGIIKIVELENAEPITDSSVTSGPIQITAYRIVLTEACNLRCTYCFQEETTDRLSTMSMPILDGVIDSILNRHKPDDFISIHWFGGEPLLRFKLIHHAMTRLAIAVEENRIGGISYDMTTHGGLVTSNIASILSEFGVKVLVSLDGGKTVNDRARIDKKGRGTFDRAIKGYRILEEHGVDVGVIVTTSFDTGPDLARGIRDLVSLLEPKRVFVNTPQPTPRGWEVDGAVFANQLFEAANECDAHNCILIGPHQKIRRALALSEVQNLDCVAPSGEMAVSVGPNGQLGHCIVSWNGIEHSQEDVWDYDVAKQWKTTSNKTSTCRKCPAETVCGGPCPLEAELIGLDEQRCAFYLTSLEKILLE